MEGVEPVSGVLMHQYEMRQQCGLALGAAGRALGLERQLAEGECHAVKAIT